MAGADVYLSATSPAAERRSLPIVADASVPAVVATTGLGESAPAWLRACARRIPIVLDANFSLGLPILRRALRAIGPMPPGFDVSIVETHRAGKSDRPSGTALLLARDLTGSGYRRWSAAEGPRAEGTVEIASLRAGETPGVHRVEIAGPAELVRFEHIAYGRETFAAGMLVAARALAGGRRRPSPGLYRFEDLLRRGAP